MFQGTAMKVPPSDADPLLQGDRLKVFEASLEVRSEELKLQEQNYEALLDIAKDSDKLTELLIDGKLAETFSKDAHKLNATFLQKKERALKRQLKLVDTISLEVHSPVSPSSKKRKSDTVAIEEVEDEGKSSPQEIEQNSKTIEGEPTADSKSGRNEKSENISGDVKEKECGEAAPSGKAVRNESRDGEKLGKTSRHRKSTPAAGDKKKPPVKAKEAPKASKKASGSSKKKAKKPKETEEYDDDNDYCCYVCEEDGELLCCEGQCLRSFHMSCIGLDKEPEGDFLCADCASGKHVCLICRVYGSTTAEGQWRVVKCSDKRCGSFYHPSCIQYQAAKFTDDENFLCSHHICADCRGGPIEGDPLVRCFRCAYAFHETHVPYLARDLENAVVCLKHWNKTAKDFISSWHTRPNPPEHIPPLEPDPSELSSEIVEETSKGKKVPPLRLMQSFPILPEQDFCPPDDCWQEMDMDPRTTWKVPKWKNVKQNIYSGVKRPRSQNEEQMQCDCTAKKPCTEVADCQNRLLKIECRENTCPVASRCQNMRFQKNDFADISLFKTLLKDWGVRANVPIQDGQFIVEYMGEIIGDEEYIRRQESSTQRHFYFMDLGDDLYLDASQKGSIARFINHSCDPNCETQKWTVGKETRVGIFALRDIKRGEELTYNYNCSIYKQRLPCHCGAKICSGFLGEPPKKIESKPLKKKKKKKKKSRTRATKKDADAEEKGLPQLIAEGEGIGKFYRDNGFGLDHEHRRGKPAWKRMQFMPSILKRNLHSALRAFFQPKGADPATPTVSSTEPSE